MGKVIEIGIANIQGNQIQNVNKVEALKGKGLLNDRKFSENNQKKRQITLIEIENINYFNNIFLITSLKPLEKSPRSLKFLCKLEIILSSLNNSN